MTRLSIKDVTLRFGTETVLDRLSLDVAEGETVVVFGPSGSGKTVLLRLIAGVHEPESGTIAIEGRDVTDLAPEERGVGMAFQNFALFPHMSAEENIATPLVARGADGSAISAAVQSVAKLLKIGHVLDHAPRALSNGQKQRTALARALIAEPKVLLLDDPLRNVDAKLRFEMRLELPRLLKRFGSGVIYVTQDYKEAMALGDRIAILVGGRFVQVGTPREIYEHPANVEVARLFGDPTINLVEVAPRRGGAGAEIDLDGTRLSLAPSQSAAAGLDCVMGVRPETIGFCTADAPGALPVMVAAVTPLNERVVTLVTTQHGREILVSRPSTEPVAVSSGPAHVRFDPGRVLLFDRARGERIAPNAA